MAINELELTIRVVNTFIDPETDEAVVVTEMNDTRTETRVPIASYFDFEGDVTVTDELNIEVRESGRLRIAPLPQSLRPPQ